VLLRMGSTDAVDQIKLLLAALGADRKGIEQVERERGFQRLIYTRSQITLAEDLHADYRLARLAPSPQRGDDGVGVSIHM